MVLRSDLFSERILVVVSFGLAVYLLNPNINRITRIEGLLWLLGPLGCKMSYSYLDHYH